MIEQKIKANDDNVTEVKFDYNCFQGGVVLIKEENCCFLFDDYCAQIVDLSTLSVIDKFIYPTQYSGSINFTNSSSLNRNCVIVTKDESSCFIFYLKFRPSAHVCFMNKISTTDKLFENSHILKKKISQGYFKMIQSIFSFVYTENSLIRLHPNTNSSRIISKTEIKYSPQIIFRFDFVFPIFYSSPIKIFEPNIIVFYENKNFRAKILVISLNLRKRKILQTTLLDYQGKKIKFADAPLYSVLIDKIVNYRTSKECSQIILIVNGTLYTPEGNTRTTIFTLVLNFKTSQDGMKYLDLKNVKFYKKASNLTPLRITKDCLISRCDPKTEWSYFKKVDRKTLEQTKTNLMRSVNPALLATNKDQENVIFTPNGWAMKVGTNYVQMIERKLINGFDLAGAESTYFFAEKNVFFWAKSHWIRAFEFKNGNPNELIYLDEFHSEEMMKIRRIRKITPQIVHVNYPTKVTRFTKVINSLVLIVKMTKWKKANQYFTLVLFDLKSQKFKKERRCDDFFDEPGDNKVFMDKKRGHLININYKEVQFFQVSDKFQSIELIVEPDEMNSFVPWKNKIIFNQEESSLIYMEKNSQSKYRINFRYIKGVRLNGNQETYEIEEYNVYRKMKELGVFSSVGLETQGGYVIKGKFSSLEFKSLGKIISVLGIKRTIINSKFNFTGELWVFESMTLYKNPEVKFLFKIAFENCSNYLEWRKKAGKSRIIDFHLSLSETKMIKSLVWIDSDQNLWMIEPCLTQKNIRYTIQPLMRANKILGRTIDNQLLVCCLDDLTIKSIHL